MKIYNKLESLGFFEWLSETHNLKDTDMKSEYLEELALEDIHRTVCNSMTFRFFRDKYKLHAVITYDENDFYEGIVKYTKLNGKFNTYEEAELACLKKLIEITKHK